MFLFTTCRGCYSSKEISRHLYAKVVKEPFLSMHLLKRKSRSIQSLCAKAHVSKLKIWTNSSKVNVWTNFQQNQVLFRSFLQKRILSHLCCMKEDQYGKMNTFLIKLKKMSSSADSQQRESVLTVPNLLCLTRITLAPVIAYLLLQSHHTLALTLLGVASATDLLDGYIARNFSNQSSVFGSMLDPAADKILMTVMTITLAYASLLPVYLCVLIVGRDLGIMSAVAYLRFKTVPKPVTITKFFDVNLPTVQMKPTLISKANTALQLALVGLCMAAPVFDFMDSQWLQAYWYLVGGTTIASGMSYVIKGKQTFRVVK